MNSGCVRNAVHKRIVGDALHTPTLLGSCKERAVSESGASSCKHTSCTEYHGPSGVWPTLSLLYYSSEGLVSVLIACWPEPCLVLQLAEDASISKQQAVGCIHQLLHTDTGLYHS